MTKNELKRIGTGCLAFAALLAAGCQSSKPAAPAGGSEMQAMPVQTVSVKLSPVAQSSDYVATIKSRRSATIQPQVSGDYPDPGPLRRPCEGRPALMIIDPRQQQATVASQLATERQKKALYDYNQIELDRQRKLFEAGVTSRDAYQQEQQAYENSKADYEAAEATARRSSSCWTTTRCARPSMALWAIFRCTWATMFDNVNDADDCRREQRSRSLHLHSHGAGARRADGPGRGAVDNSGNCWRRQRSISFRRRWTALCRRSW